MTPDQLQIINNKLKSALSEALEAHALGLPFPYLRLKTVLAEVRKLESDVSESSTYRPESRISESRLGFFDEQYGDGEK